MTRYTVILLATVLMACGNKDSPEQDAEWEDMEPVDPAVEPAEEPEPDPVPDPVEEEPAEDPMEDPDEEDPDEEEPAGECEGLSDGADCGAACQWCQSGVCVDVPDNQDPFMDCSTCHVCDGSGGCRLADDGRDPKDECTAGECTADDCTAGSCALADGIACGTACQWCSSGSCVDVPSIANRDPFDDCPSCRVCDGAGSCRIADPGTDPDGDCGTGSCEGHLQTSAMTCDSTGTCAASGDVLCAPYRCDLTTCRTSCSSDEHCIGGNVCTSGACVREARNVVFVTGERYRSWYDFATPAEADAICTASATAGGIPGTFTAWLSISTANARDRLTGRGWVRPDRREFADSISDLTSGEIFHPIRIDEFGREVLSDLLVYTGTLPDGTASSGTCADWRASSGTSAQFGIASAGTDYWTEERISNCGDYRRLYCFGTDHDTALAPTTHTGRIAFLSASPFVLGGGLSAADALCVSEASSAGLSGTFLAFLATDTVSAITRFGGLGPTWVRPDGVRIVEYPVDLLGILVSPISQQADGTYSSGVTWGGAHTVDTVTGYTCTNWTSTSSTRRSASGKGGDTILWFKDFNTYCDSTTTHIYCLER